MERLILHRGAQEIDLFNLIPFCTVSKAECQRVILSTDQLNITVESTSPMLFYIGDYILFESRKYKLNLNPKLNKVNNSHYIYNLTFEAVQYDLIKRILFNTTKQGEFIDSEFVLTAEIDTFGAVIVNNANRDNGGYTWELGEFPANTEAKTMTFNSENTLVALQNICKEFDTEFEIVEDNARKVNVLHFRKIGSVLPYSFEYGYRNGLYSLNRDNVSEAQVTTRIYVYGSDQNILSNYRGFSKRLRLPLTHGVDYFQDQAKIDKYGLVDGIKIFDDIKPTFKGIITALKPANGALFSFVCDNMDFDLKEKDDKGNTKYLIAGTPAKLHINKGNLAGNEFEITNYDHATKTFTVKQFQDERGQKFPDPETSVFNFNVGDEFTLLELILPQSYIDNAEAKLFEKGLAEYNKVSQNNVKYQLEIDPQFFKELGFVYDPQVAVIKIGDYINVKDSALAIDKTSRINSLTIDLLEEFKYSTDIADSYEISLIQQILEDIADTQIVTQTLTVTNRLAMQSGYKRMNELKGIIFDPDGYFDPENIKPNSIETNMLSVGAKSQQLTLEGVIFNTNVNGNKNSISISAGKLIHFSIDENIKEWSLQGINTTLPDDDTYFVYARIKYNGINGSFRIVKEKLKFDSEAGYYNFLVATVFKPQNNIRLIELMYGATFIHGRTVTAGRIQNIAGTRYFDIDTGEFKGDFVFTNGTNVQTAVSNAQATANNAISTLNDISNDNKLTPSEKQALVVEWNRIQTEYSQNSSIATTLGLAITTYQNAYNTLNSYITPLLSNLTITSDIVGTTFRSNFQNYYSKNVAIVTLIENKKIENIQIGGRNLIIKSRIDTLIYNNENKFIFWNTLSEPLKVGSTYVFRGFNKTKEFPELILSDAVNDYNNGQFIVEGVPFVAQFPSKSIRSYHRSGYGDYYVEYIKLEKGNKATDWTPAPEDVQAQIDTNTANTATALAQANNAINTANNVANLTSFLQTSIQGNVVGTGTLLVGDVLGANAGISGVTDRSGSSVRIWAGATYAGKNTANWLMRDDGVEEQWFNGILVRQRGVINGAYVEAWYNLNGQIGKKITFSADGKILEEWYNNGTLVYQIGQNGIYYVAEIPESFTFFKLLKLNSDIESTDGSIFHNLIRQNMYQKASNPTRFTLQGDTDSYLYNAGQNVYSQGNKQYEGFKTSQNKLSNMPNGWYAYVGAMLEDSPMGTKRQANLIRLSNGKIINQISTYVETNGYTFNQN